MHPKQRLQTFDLVAGTVVIGLVVLFWSITRAIALVQPADFSFNRQRPADSVPVAVPVDERPDLEADRLAAVEELKGQLDKILAGFKKAEPNDYGIFIKHLPSGTVASLGADQEFITASLYKPFAAVAALKLVEQGKLGLNQPIAEDGRTVKQCVTDSISLSDNPCGLALLNVTGLATNSGQAALKNQGYKATDLRGLYPVSTARDVARLFGVIHAGQDLAKSSRKLVMDVLLDQKVVDRWPAGLLPGAKLAHKTGDLEGYAHDAGLVLSEESGDYVIVVLSGPDSSGRLLDQRYVRFGELLKSVHKIMLKYGPPAAGQSS